MSRPSWCWEPGQLAALVTGEPHLGCVLGIIITTEAVIIITLASSHQKSCKKKLVNIFG